MSKFVPENPWLFVEITKPSSEEIKKYSEGTIKSSANTEADRFFKKAKIVATYSERKYPIDSIWMMGESDGMKINYFGTKITMVQRKDLYARIE